MEEIEEKKGNLIDDEFSEVEMQVIYHFIDNGNRRKAYRKYIKDKKTDSAIYRWFQKKDVQQKIIEIGNELSIYDTVSDKALLNIISNPNSADRDKIAAVKTWNDLRKRVSQTITLQHNSNIDFSNVNDENLESIVKQILTIENATKPN
jgi:RecG-like helicase